MIANTGGVEMRIQGQHITQQFSRQIKRHCCPSFGLQIEALNQSLIAYIGPSLTFTIQGTVLAA